VVCLRVIFDLELELFVHNEFAAKKIIFQFHVKCRAVPANPPQQHCRMFLFFAQVMRQYRFQRPVFAGVGRGL